MLLKIATGVIALWGSTYIPWISTKIKRSLGKYNFGDFISATPTYMFSIYVEAILDGYLVSTMTLSSWSWLALRRDP